MKATNEICEEYPGCDGCPFDIDNCSHPPNIPREKYCVTQSTYQDILSQLYKIDGYEWNKNRIIALLNKDVK